MKGSGWQQGWEGSYGEIRFECGGGEKAVKGGELVWRESERGWQLGVELRECERGVG